MKKVLRKITILLFLMSLLNTAMCFGSEISGNTEFKKWLADFYPVAQKEGVTRATWDKAFSGITEPDPKVLEKAQYQPEFTTEVWDYLDGRVNPLSIEKGQKMARMYARTLAAVEKKFGVEQSVLLAIWSIESNYGTALEQVNRLHYVPQALATLAYGDPNEVNSPARS